MKTNQTMKTKMKTKHALCGLLSGLLLLAAGTAQTHAGLLVPAAPGSKLYQGNGSSNILAFTPGGVGSVFATDAVNLGRVQDLAFDGAGNLFAADLNTGKISKITPNGVSSVFASANAFGLAFDNSGFLYVADRSTTNIVKYSPSGVASVFASSGLLGGGPTALAFDNAGNLFVAEHFSNDIVKITPGGVVSAFATVFGGSFGLAFDSAGNLFVANTGGNFIRKITPSGVVSGFAFVNNPQDLAFDSLGDLYVSSRGENNIRKFSSSGTDLGVFADSGDGINFPMGLAFAPVPEPGTALFGIACVGVAALRRRRSAAVAAKLTA